MMSVLVMWVLKEKGLEKDTIVIFSSDNGPAYQNGYYDGTTGKIKKTATDRGHGASGIYRGGKGSVYEGGTRVPFIFSWPGKVKPGVSDALVGQIDLLASFSELLEVPLPDGAGHDSRNLLDTFLGKSDQGATYMLEGNNALRYGNWKYIKPINAKRKEHLYDLSTDPGEENNLAETNPEMLQTMKKKHDEILSSGRMTNIYTELGKSKGRKSK